MANLPATRIGAATDGEGKAEVWARFGDIGRFALIGASLVVPLRRGKFDHCFNSATSVLAAASVCKALKAVVHERRPNGEDNNGFPSQHAAEAFAAGLALRHHSGPVARASAGAATMVAMSRIFARKHRPPDVVAGILIGVAATIAAEKYCAHRQLET